MFMQTNGHMEIGSAYQKIILVTILAAIRSSFLSQIQDSKNM